MLSVDLWKYNEPRQGEYDSLMGMLEGRFRNASQPTLIYVCALRKHPCFVKVGITKAVANGLRFIDPEFGEILYDSSRDQEFNKRLGRDLPRVEAWLREQYIFAKYSEMRESIPALKDGKWSGWTETFRVPNVSKVAYVRRSKVNQGLRASIAGGISCLLSIENKYTQRVAESSRDDFISGIRSLLLWSTEQTPETWKRLASEVCTTISEKEMLTERYSQFLRAYECSQQEAWVKGFEEFYENDHVDHELSEEECMAWEAVNKFDQAGECQWRENRFDTTIRGIEDDTYRDSEDDSVGDDWY